MGVTPERAARTRVNLVAVARSLRRVQAVMARPEGRDPFDDRVLENMVSGYAYVEALVRAQVDPFAFGHLKQLLELNCLVLCGTSPERRAAYTGHLQATEARFYGKGAAGVRDLVEWVADHPDGPPSERAAGVYAMILGWPQLFIEGNHRTGVLAMSCVLRREDRAPFVLTPANATAYFEISAGIHEIAKDSTPGRLRLATLTARLARLLADDSDRRDLVA
jgi:hypothetical protein